MCAAGQAQEHISFNFQIELEVASSVYGFTGQQPIQLHFVVPTTRGPPFFAL
jgi:hypothetical protein